MVKALQGEDHVVRLKTMMETAIAEEHYTVSDQIYCKTSRSVYFGMIDKQVYTKEE